MRGVLHGDCMCAGQCCELHILKLEGGCELCEGGCRPCVSVRMTAVACALQPLITVCDVLATCCLMMSK
jgi:hypothetical protein